MVRVASLGLAVVMTAGVASAQSQAAPAAAAELVQKWRVTVSFAADFSEGTQRGRTVKSDTQAVLNAGRTPELLRSITRFRGEGTYVTGQKPGAPKVVSGEMFFAEAMQAVDLKQFGSLFGGSISPRTRDTDLWLYGVGSVYHHIAFGLVSEQAYGIGVSRILRRVAGLTVGADLRHIDEHFNGQAPFASWAARLVQSYGRQFVSNHGKPNERTFTVTQNFEIIPAFASAGALQARGSVGLSIPVLPPRLSMTLGFGDDYMKNAAPPAKQHYWKGSLGVTISLGPP